MADWLARKGRGITPFTHGLLPFLIILGIVAGLVVVEPDMGTAVIICAVAFSVFFVAGANLWHLVTRVRAGRRSAGMCVATYAAPIALSASPASSTRSADPLGKGWQAMQTFIALGSGGLTAVGLGHEPPEGVLPAERAHRLDPGDHRRGAWAVGTMTVVAAPGHHRLARLADRAPGARTRLGGCWRSA